MRTISILDAVLRDIDNQVAAFAPERGGALLTSPDRRLITRFVLDEDAETTRVSYRPSRELNRRVQDLEETQQLQLGGILHSHPFGLDHPSGQDELELETGLRLNPHLTGYLAPIVTHDDAGTLAEHELPLSSAKISFFIAERESGGRVAVRPQPVALIPLTADLERLATAHGGTVMPDVTTAELDSVAFAVGRLTRPDGDIFILVDEHYPTTPPFVLTALPDGGVEQRDVPWRLDVPAEQRLLHACAGVLGAPDGTTVEPTTEVVQAGLFARTTGLLSEALLSKEVLIVGLGSVGSQAAEGLVRAGVGRVTLIDPETVEPANLSRTVYRANDIGRSKTEALTDRLLAINPGLVVEGIADNLLALGGERLDALVGRADLVLAATDDPAAQRALNRFAYGRGKPALFVGLYAGAQGGEVVISVPAQTACYLCATFVRHAVEADTTAVQPHTDYGTGRLPGEIALGADIQHVVSVGTKLAASLLTRGEAGSLGQFLEPMLADGTSYLTLGMAPNYWFYPEVFAQTIGQFAYQSVWLTPTKRPDCPVCGQSPLDPLAVPLRAPGLTALRQQRPSAARSDEPSGKDPGAMVSAIPSHA